MTVSKKEFSDALLQIGESLHALDVRLARLEAGLLAVKAFLATVLNPANPGEALGRIEAAEKRAEKRQPGAASRESTAQQIDLLKLFEKHGPPKDS